jgi:hypothetical protein
MTTPKQLLIASMNKYSLFDKNVTDLILDFSNNHREKFAKCVSEMKLCFKKYSKMYFHFVPKIALQCKKCLKRKEFFNQKYCYECYINREYFSRNRRHCSIYYERKERYEDLDEKINNEFNILKNILKINNILKARRAIEERHVKKPVEVLNEKYFFCPSCDCVLLKSSRSGHLITQKHIKNLKTG